jgi:PQQ-dependent dehydrogenase (methanol/ethanol family)
MSKAGHMIGGVRRCWTFLSCAVVSILLLSTAPVTAQPSVANRSVDWPRFGNTGDQQRYAALTQITAHTVQRLGVAWTMPQGYGSVLWEDDPVVVGGVMYLTTGTDQVIAVRADTGRRLWTYTPDVNFFSLLASGDNTAPVNRGVEVAQGRVYLLTFDDQLICLQATTGKVIWRRVIADARTYYEQSPPTYWRNLLLVGEIGIGPGVRGFVAAFNAQTGKQQWRFYTVPAPGKSWVRAKGQVGGGDVWMPVTVDTTTGIVYLGTGNPTPDLVSRDRPGCNPWTDATLALDARTGRLLWGRTQVCTDVWDYDSAQPPMLLSVVKGNRMVRAVGQGSKSGRYWIFDARTGATLAISPPLGLQTTPRPVPTPAGTKVCPGIYGSLEYSPPAYSPRTRLIYLPGLNLCTIDMALPVTPKTRPSPAVQAFGGTVTLPHEQPTGFLAAMDPASGRIAWQVPIARPMIGGALVTAGDVVFSGADDGYFYAFNAHTGAILWQHHVGLGFGAAPISYMVNGIQYVAIAAGGSAVAPETGAHLGGLLVVFKLSDAPIK